MIRTVVAALALAALGLIVTACEQDPLGRSGAQLRAEQAACDSRGGAWGPGGITGGPMCFTRPADAGQACTRDSDCSSYCLANDGRLGGSCAAVSPLFGCFVMLDDAGRKVELCAD